MPYAGPNNNSLIGSCDTYVKSRTYAFGLKPSSLAFASDMIKQADAPSVYECEKTTNFDWTSNETFGERNENQLDLPNMTN